MPGADSSPRPCGPMQSPTRTWIPTLPLESVWPWATPSVSSPDSCGVNLHKRLKGLETLGRSSWHIVGPQKLVALFPEPERNTSGTLSSEIPPIGRTCLKGLPGGEAKTPRAHPPIIRLTNRNQFCLCHSDYNFIIHKAEPCALFDFHSGARYQY